MLCSKRGKRCRVVTYFETSYLVVDVVRCGMRGGGWLTYTHSVFWAKFCGAYIYIYILYLVEKNGAKNRIGTQNVTGKSIALGAGQFYFTETRRWLNRARFCYLVFSPVQFRKQPAHVFAGRTAIAHSQFSPQGDRSSCVIEKGKVQEDL